MQDALILSRRPGGAWRRRGDRRAGGVRPAVFAVRRGEPLLYDLLLAVLAHSDRDVDELLDDCVHPVRAPDDGAFHPKVWFGRFVDEDGEALIRAAVSSRNLTFDRSWDVAIVSENRPEGRRPVPESRGLAYLLRSVPDVTHYVFYYISGRT